VVCLPGPEILQAAGGGAGVIRGGARKIRGGGAGGRAGGVAGEGAAGWRRGDPRQRRRGGAAASSYCMVDAGGPGPAGRGRASKEGWKGQDLVIVEVGPLLWRVRQIPTNASRIF